jgi:hypothetical protein
MVIVIIMIGRSGWWWWMIVVVVVVVVVTMTIRRTSLRLKKDIAMGGNGGRFGSGCNRCCWIGFFFRRRGSGGCSRCRQ